MQHPLPEYFVAEKQAELERELKHNGLLHEAEHAKTRQQGFIGNILHALSIWIIRVGERVHERYYVSAHLPGVQEEGG